MPVVRFAVLAALVVWLGGAVQNWIVAARFRPSNVAAGCGAIMIAGLVVMKFVGPPPRAFVWRVGLVVLMLAAALASALFGPSAATQAATVLLGLLLLTWYARE